MSVIYSQDRALLWPLILVFFAFSSCSSPSESETSTETTESFAVSSEQVVESPSTPILSDYTYIRPEDITVLEELTVISESGLTYRDKPSINGERLGSFDQNTIVELLSRTGKEFSVKSNGDTIEGEWFGLRLPIEEHSYMVYAFSGFLSTSTASQTGYGWSSVLDRNHVDYRELNVNAGELMSVSEISKDRYLSLLKDSTSYLDKSRKIKKVKHNMALHLAKGDTIIKDIDPDSVTDNTLTHYYVGEVQGIQAYLVQRNEFELLDFVAIDTESGHAKGSYSELPRFSPRYDQAISIYNDPYNETGDLSLYKIDSDGRATLDTLLAFTHWAPAFNDAIHWLSEHRIVCKAIPRDAHWNATHANDEFLYLELMLK